MPKGIDHVNTRNERQKGGDHAEPVHACPSYAKNIDEFFESVTYAVISSIIVIITLFADDIREVAFPPSADIYFSVLNLICIGIYVVEMIVLSLIKDNYFLRFYFWLDLFSTATMVFDLIWITNLMTGGGKNAANIAQVSKASRAARLGSRTIRLIRLFRLIRIIKMYKAASKTLAKKTERLFSERHVTTVVKHSWHLQNRIESLRNMQRQPSKRWTLLKQVNCLQTPKQKNHQISINCLPLKEVEAPENIVIVQARHEDQPDKLLQPKDNNIQREKSQGSHKRVMKTEILQRPRQFTSTFKNVMAFAGSEDNKLPSIGVKGPIQPRFESRQEYPSEVEIEIPDETKVSLKVKDQIQKNIILMIILILISVPLLDSQTWFLPLNVYQKSIEQLIYIKKNYPPAYDVEAKEYIGAMLNMTNPLVSFTITVNNSCCTFPDNYPQFLSQINNPLSNLRVQDMDIYQSDDYNVVFDMTSSNTFASLLNIGRTFFVCVLLLITSMLFSNDIESTALEPLQEMFDTVRKIAINPLNALREIEQKNMCLQALEKDQDMGVRQTEPKLLQNTIVKIGSLLAVGFGQAGTEIICRVIQDPSIINVMIPGRKMMAIFGFCDIRNFTDATEILQADVMVFVNQIAEICHRVVYQHLGSPNKNIGDAFLLVWKFNDDDVNQKLEGEEKIIELLPTKRVKQIADLAVLSFVKMIAEMTKSYTLQKYKNNRLLQQRIKNYTGVKMGFGLHVGWAIEGPIGSQYKIDASYLSSHVHMASRLEGATKQYGVPMLITGQVRNLMTERNKEYLRQVDRVLVGGQTNPIDLFSVDLSPVNLLKAVGIHVEKKLNQRQKRHAKVYRNANRKKLLENIQTQYMTEAMWADEDVRLLREPYSQLFFDEFKKGLILYIRGEWPAALESLKKAAKIAPGHYDGPSEDLIKYMEVSNGIAPREWQGYRPFQ